MYARKYYLIIYRRNLLPEYSRASQQPIVFLCKVTFDLLTFLPFAAYIIFIKFTSFTIHLVHHSLFHHSLFHFHFFTFFSPFSLLFLSLSPSISPTIHSSLPHNIRDKDWKKTGQLFRFSQKCINFAAIKNKFELWQENVNHYLSWRTSPSRPLQPRVSASLA